jgi:hypothetical protein
MACGCNSGSSGTQTPEPQYEVTLPNGSTEVVTGEHAAKVKITMAGGGSYRKL